jgi:hypothetical protein
MAHPSTLCLDAFKHATDWARVVCVYVYTVFGFVLHDRERTLGIAHYVLCMVHQSKPRLHGFKSATSLGEQDLLFLYLLCFGHGRGHLALTFYSLRSRRESV